MNPGGGRRVRSNMRKVNIERTPESRIGRDRARSNALTPCCARKPSRFLDSFPMHTPDRLDARPERPAPLSFR